jgi:hypothetical protein
MGPMAGMGAAAAAAGSMMGLPNMSGGWGGLNLEPRNLEPGT